MRGLLKSTVMGVGLLAAVTVTAASNPTPIAVDLSKPRILNSPVLDHVG